MITRRQLGVRMLLGASAALLAGCGFRPVYAPTADGTAGAGAQGLAQIRVALIKDRSGQLLRQDLQQRFDGTGAGAAKLYELSVAYNVGQEGVAIQQTDSVATRTRVVASATWSLFSMDTQRRTVTSGRARTIDGFNPLDGQFFYTELQYEQALHRVSETVADQIALELGVYFNQHPTGN
jgi:LPS-assembly lipoprotein